jgi:hypothetical protein
MAHRGGRQDCNRILADHAHELAAPPPKFTAIHGSLQAHIGQTGS